MTPILSICLLVILSNQPSQINAYVTQTHSNSTGQYFITNNSLWYNQFGYNSETITCNHPSLCYFECYRFGCINLEFNTSSSNVIINCNGYKSCRGNFNLSLSDNLFIYCNEPWNCQDINVYVGNNNTIKESTAYVYLINTEYVSYVGRWYENFHLENVDVVNIKCDGLNACGHTTLYCPYHKENACNVWCGEKACNRYNRESLNLKVNQNYAINWLNYSLELQNGYVPQYGNKVTCVDHLGKETGSISSTLITYNGVNVCQYYSNCCPYSSVKISNDNYTNGWHINDCIQGYDCFIDCSSQYKTSGVLSECGYRTIDGSFSTSVTVLCPDAYSCDNTRVICPINGGECNVNVTIEGGSNGLRINATSFIGDDLNINLNCLADNSCYDTYIFANNTIGSNISMNINCISSDISGDYACNPLIVNGSSSDLNNINIKYQRRGLDMVMNYYGGYPYPQVYGKFYLYGASDVNIHCNGMGACLHDVFHLENTSNIDVRCDGITNIYNSGSCRYSEFYVDGAANVNIECISNFNCYETHIFAADSNKLDLICDGDGSCTELAISYPPLLNPYDFTLKCYDGIFDYSCNGIRIDIHDEFTENFIDLFCESNDACNYIYFHCDTKGISIVNPDGNYHSCLSNNCCPIDGIRSETNEPTTSPSVVSIQTTIQTTKKPTVSPNTVSIQQPTSSDTAPTKMPNANTNNYGLSTSTLLTTYKPDVSSATDHLDLRSQTSTLNGSRFGMEWIVLIIVAVIFCFIGAIYVAYKMGVKKQIKKQPPVIPSFQLIKVQDINNAEGVDNVQDIDNGQDLNTVR